MDIPIGADSPTDNLYLALVQCFAIIICGYIAGRLNVITKSEANGLNTFVGTFALPSLIFMSLVKLDFTLVNWKFLLAVLIAKSCVFFIVLTVSMVVTKPSNPGRAALFAIFTTQSNDFAIGYPMIQALYGATHPEYSAYLYLMAPISLAILNPVGFVLLEIGKGRHNSQIEEQNAYSKWKMIKSIIKGIAFNPVLFMTVLGIIGNLLFTRENGIPAVIEATLDVFGNAFSASALFLLGLMMVGKVHRLKGAALVIPGILISIKLLVLPLVIRESITLLSAGENSTDTADLSTYGFLYGTIPTAPALFIFTLRYNLEIDLIASAMVACTFLSAPLMFVSAKVISAASDGMVNPLNFARQLNAFSMDIGVISMIACLWLLICFLFLEGKKFQRVTHRCTLCLTIGQLLTATGIIIWANLNSNHTGSVLWYIQFVLITSGVYASRLCTTALAATLLFLSSRSVSFVQKMQKWILPIVWIIPLLMVSIICLTVSPKKPDKENQRNPNFQLGQVEAALSVIILIFSFVVTLGCLVLQQRYQRRNDMSSSYSSLITSQIPSTPNVTTTSITRTDDRNVVDVEDLLTSSTNLISSGSCNIRNGCPSGLCSINEEADLDDEFGRNYNGREGDVGSGHNFEDPQVLRHLVLLILLLSSMFIGLALSVGTLIMEQMTAIYAELTFLDVALNFGQSVIVFAIFGLDPSLGRLGSWIKKLCLRCRAGKELQLPGEEDLSSEAKAIREQFNNCHLDECRARISMCHRRFFKVYRGVFSGVDLVNWLLEAGVAQNREEAVKYGRCLLESRVLHHIDGTHHFHDQNLLYTFRG